jgi:hypothetical protein
LNQTEQLAYEWLQNQGIAKQDIIFQSKKTPDFLTPVGEYEVKKSQGKKILFSGDQEKLLKTDITFLVYSKNTQPPLVMKASELEKIFTLYIPQPNKITKRWKHCIKCNNEWLARTPNPPKCPRCQEPMVKTE